MGMRVVTRHIGISRPAPQRKAQALDGACGTVRAKGVAALTLLLAATTLSACGANAINGTGSSLSGVTRTYHRGYVMSEGALEQVPVGSSQEQVLLVLGTPSTVATLNGDVFYYISQTQKKVAFLKPEITEQKVLAIYFDKNRRVTRIAEYGMKDGKVFDFISQTTPTSGEELSLLQQVIGLVSF